MKNFTIKKVLETRALPPKVEEMNNHIAVMEQMVAAAQKEKRTLNNEENTKFNDLKAKVNKLKVEIKAEQEQRTATIPTIKLGDLDIIKPGESLMKNEYRSADTIKFGDIVKAMSGKSTSSKANQYVRSMTSATGAVIIPKELSSTIFDMARAKSAVFGRVPAVTMDSNNLTIAKISKDAEAHFVAEGELIPESAALFEGVTLEGKTMAIYVPVSEQLLSSANISDLLMSACANAIASALDKGMVYGDGTGANIKGLATYDGINKVSHTGNVNYNMMLNGVKATKNANITPTDIVINTNTSTDLAMLVDSSGQYVLPPKSLENYIINESNNIEDNQALVFDSDSLLVGINEGITIEWGYSNDGFQRLVKALRIYIRCDLGVINEKGVSLVTAKASK